MRNAFFFLFLFSGFTLFAVTDPLLSQTINLSTRQEVAAMGFRNSQDTCVSPPEGMVAWWPLDEISGTTVTDIVNGFNGTTQPGPIGGSTGPGPTPTLPSSFPPGMVGSSLFFGSTRHIRVPHNPNLDPDTGSFAVDFWFIWGGGSGPIIQKMLPTGEGWGIFLVQSSSNPGTANVEVRWRFASGTAMPVAALGITSNRWYHLYAGIIRGGGIGGDYSSFLLFDPQLGIQYQTGPGVVPGIIAPTETVSTAADLIIGGDGVSPGPQIAIDEIEIFGRTLSIQEIVALEFSGKAGKCKPTCVPPPQGMVGWWPLDETSSPANDLAGVNNTGTWINNPTPVAGKVGGALYFFPPNYVEVSPHPELDLGTGDFSIDAWVRPVDCSHGPAHILSPIVDKFNGTNGFSFYLDQPNVGVANLYLNINGSTFTSSGTIPTLGSSTWSHIAVTVKRGVSGPGVGTFYINGSPAGTFTPPLGTVTNSVPLWIGEIRVPGAGRCEIAIDELEIFNRALDSTEIHSIWAAGSLGKCKQPPSPPETGKNHYKSWRIEPVPVDTFALTQDQFTLQQLRLSAVVGISNPVRKIINSPVRSDTFDIMRPDDHLTVYRAEGKPIAVQVEYENQFEHTKVFLDSVKYLLVPAQKVPHAPPTRLDHYTAYRIRNPISFASRCELQDQFDQLDKTSEFIDTLSQAYFLTPTRKNKEPVYDTLTHYVAYEIHPERRTSQPWWSFTDQFGNYRLFVLDSKYLLVPTKKLSFVTGVSEEGAIPAGFALLQSYPNPFNPTTTIEYHVPVSGFVKLSVFDILGREIAVLVDGNVQAGKHKVTFDASGFAAGLYFYRMQAGKFQETRKLILLK